MCDSILIVLTIIASIIFQYLSIQELQTLTYKYTY